MANILKIAATLLLVSVGACAHTPAPVYIYEATFMDKAGNVYVADYDLSPEDCARYTLQGYACEINRVQVIQ